jgi:hypothetical protein
MSEDTICGLILAIFFGGMVLSVHIFGIIICIASHIFTKKHKKCYELIDNHNKEMVKCNHYWADNIIPLEKQIDKLEMQKKYATLDKIKTIEQEQEKLKERLGYHRELLEAMAKTTREKCEQLKKEIYDYMKNYKFFKKYVEEMNFIYKEEL